MTPQHCNKALAYFDQNDQIMARLVRAGLADANGITLPVLKKPDLYFESIISSIIGQQISVKAAAAVRGRVVAFLNNSVTPESVLAADPEALRNCGLSAQKTKYLIHNATLWPELSTQNFNEMNDEKIIIELTKLYGVGRWTAEMFLMSSLGRPDVFSYGDHGLMQGLYQSYNYKPHYVRKIRTTVEGWSPYRTLASLALWHHKDNAPL